MTLVAPQVSKGLGATFTPTTGSFNFTIIDVTLPDLKSTPVKTTSQATAADSAGTIWDTYVSSQITDPGTVKFKTVYDILAYPPVGLGGSLVITIPETATPSTIKTHTYSNAILVESVANANIGALIEGTLTFKLSGVPAIT